MKKRSEKTIANNKKFLYIVASFAILASINQEGIDMEHLTLVPIIDNLTWKVLTPCATFWVEQYHGRYDVYDKHGETFRTVDSLDDVRYAVFNHIEEGKV